MHKLSSVARRLLSAGSAVLALMSLLSCSTIARSDDRGELTYGPSPRVPDGKPSWLPTVKWSVASETWPTNATPKAASGLTVNAFARDLKHPRWLYVLPNGDVLVAEAATEPTPTWSPRAIIQNWVQRRSGAIVENANRISLLRDTDGDVEQRRAV